MRTGTGRNALPRVCVQPAPPANPSRVGRVVNSRLCAAKKLARAIDSLNATCYNNKNQRAPTVMKLLVDIPAVTFRRLEVLLRRAVFDSANQAVVAALESYLVLSEAREGSADTVDASTVTPPSLDNPAGAVGDSVPRGLSLAHVDDVKIAEMPSVDEVSNRKYHLFGIGRLGPLKAGIRALLVLLSDTEGPIKLSEFKGRAGTLVRELGDWLARDDEAAKRRNRERLSSGFPRSGSTSEETRASEDRYSFFVLGDVQKKSRRVDGALHRLRLISIEALGDGEGLVRITGPGHAFGLLPSPLLDAVDGRPQMAFSEEEAEWYLRHVLDHVPDERDTIRRFLVYLASGFHLPRQLYEAMGPDYADLSDNARRNICSCVMGRLVDLRLVEHAEPKGYGLSHRGREVLGELNQGP